MLPQQRKSGVRGQRSGVRGQKSGALSVLFYKLLRHASMIGTVAGKKDTSKDILTSTGSSNISMPPLWIVT